MTFDSDQHRMRPDELKEVTLMTGCDGSHKLKLTKHGVSVAFKLRGNKEETILKVHVTYVNPLQTHIEVITGNIYNFECHTLHSET